MRRTLFFELMKETQKQKDYCVVVLTIERVDFSSLPQADYRRKIGV